MYLSLVLIGQLYHQDAFNTNISLGLCRYSKYTITSLEKLYKPKLFVEPDLGIPLDLLDLSVYKYWPQLL